MRRYVSCRFNEAGDRSLYSTTILAYIKYVQSMYVAGSWEEITGGFHGNDGNGRGAKYSTGTDTDARNAGNPVAWNAIT